MSQAEAGALVEVIGMDDYRPIPATWSRLSRLRSTELGTRVKWVLGLVTRYFFSSPFVHRHLPAETGVAVAFDVTVCPLDEYFKDQGVPELTPNAACNLDHCLARAFDIELVRTQTIAHGAEYCDFRWRFPATGTSRSTANAVSAKHNAESKPGLG